MQPRQYLKIDPSLMLLLEAMRAVEALMPLLPYQSRTSEPAHVLCQLETVSDDRGGLLEFKTCEEGPDVLERYVTFEIEDRPYEDSPYYLSVEVRQESAPGSDSMYTHRTRLEVKAERAQDRKELATRMAVTVCAYFQSGQATDLLHMSVPESDIVAVIE